MRLLLALFCNFLFIIGFAQKNTLENSLLWRISGKGLAKPSYLYGTMHVKDKRVFYTNDSLQYFISSSDLFALELHPDSMNALLFNISEKDSSVSYHNYFNDEEYEMVDYKLQKDLGISLKELKTRNLKHLKMLLSPTKKRNDDYPTFLDGYLLNIARRQKRGILGLESNRSHESAFEVFGSENNVKEEIVELSKEQKSESTYSKMIKSYSSENIDEIYHLLADHSFDMSEKVLNIRNIEMAKTIDSVIKQNTLFAACGSAHLGGEKGIIQLLRKMGYSVVPVISTKKNYLNVDKLPNIFENYWQKISMPSFGVNYVLPGAPIQYKKVVFISETKMYMDISTGSVYMVLPVSIAVDMSSEKRTLFEKVAEGMLKRAPERKGLKKEFGKLGNAEYMDISFEFNMGYKISARLFIENNILYDFLIVSPINYNIKKEADYFFSGISFYKPVEQKIHNYGNQDWNFELNLPDKPVEVKSRQDAGGSIVDVLSLKTSDNINGIHYILECVEAGEGRYYVNDTAVLNQVYDNLKNQKRLVSLKDSMFVLQGSIAKQLVAVFDDYSTGVIWTVMRGFKFYCLTAITSQKGYESGAHRAVFESFQFTNPKLTDFKWTKAQFDSLFIIKLPGHLKHRSGENDSTEDDTKLYSSFEKGFGITYYLQKFKEGDYFYSVNDSVYWKNIEDKLLNYTDTLLESEPLPIKNLNGHKYVIKERNSTYTKYYNVFNFGDSYYTFYSNIPDKVVSDYLMSPFNNIIYNGNIVKYTVNDTTAFQKLIGDYYSNDSVRRTKAENNIYRFKMTDNMYSQFIKAYEKAVRDSLPELQRSLLIKFRDFDKLKVLSYAKSKLFTVRDDTIHDEDYLRILARNKTEETNRLIKTFFSTRVHKLSEYSSIFYALSDSLPLAKMFYPDVLQAISKDTAENFGLISLTRSMLDSSLITFNSIKEYENDLFNYSLRYINAYVKNKDFLGYYFPTDCFDILFKSTNSSMRSRLLDKLQHSANPWGRYYNMVYGFKNGSAPDQRIVNELVKIPYFRNFVYNELDTNKRLDIFPSNYKNQKAIAEGDLTARLIDYDEYTPTDMKFVKEIKTLYNKREVIFYIFKVKFSDDEDYYAAYTGPYSLNGELNNNGDVTGLGDKYVKGFEEIALQEYLEKIK